MAIELSEFDPADDDRLVEFLTSNEWPFHVRRWPTVAQVEQSIANGAFTGPSSRTFWIDADAGLITLSELSDPTPMFDLRIAAARRRQGLGQAVLRSATDWLFGEYPAVSRFEGHTRVDNVAMRKAFRAAGFIKEAHYRQAWPDDRGANHDAVAYAILRHDWSTGEQTPVHWDDESN